VIASGPSLTAQQASAAAGSGARTVVVNGSWNLLHDADVLFALDYLYWKTNIATIRRRFRGALWTTDNSSRERFALNRWPGTYAAGLSRTLVHTCGNSGCGAIGLACCFGARRILLLGFDMRLGDDGAKHWHADHPAPLVQAQDFKGVIHKTKKMAEDAKALGVDIVNCSPGSATPYFRRSTLQDELPCTLPA
jgi:hypothetical protein